MMMLERRKMKKKEAAHYSKILDDMDKEENRSVKINLTISPSFDDQSSATIDECFILIERKTHERAREKRLFHCFFQEKKENRIQNE